MEEQKTNSYIFALRTTANREDQVMDFITSNAAKKKLAVYSVIKAHGMRGYIFVEAANRQEAEQAAFNVPYARGILPKEIEYKEIEHMLEQVKVEMNILKNDIVEIISGPFKREEAKVTRIDKGKEEVVVELLEAAVPIPITLKMDSIKVIRRESEEEEAEEEVPLMPREEPAKSEAPIINKVDQEEAKEEESKMPESGKLPMPPVQKKTIGEPVADPDDIFDDEVEEVEEKKEEPKKEDSKDKKE